VVQKSTKYKAFLFQIKNTAVVVCLAVKPVMQQHKTCFKGEKLPKL